MDANHPLDANFAYSVILFAVGIFVCSVLVSATYVLTRRSRSKGPVYADISKLATDRIILNISTSVLVLMECATLLWDSVSYAQFPVLLRWPVVTVSVATIGFSALRLISQYLRIHNELNNGASVCPRTGYQCAVKPQNLTQIGGKFDAN